MTGKKTLMSSTTIDDDVTFESALDEQTEKIRALKRVIPNFKRLGQAKMTAGATQGRIETLKNYWENCVALHRVLQKLSNEEEKADEYFEDDLIGAAEEAYLEDLGFLYDHLRGLQPAPGPTADANATANQPIAGLTGVKFNAINLPKFSGDPTTWDTFRDLYESMIHNNTVLPKSHKFHYLRECLSGEPLNLIDTKRISDRNYDSAWPTLTTRYNDESGLIWAYLKSLFEIPAMKDSSGKELHRLVDATRRAREGLINLKRPVNKWDDMLVYMTVGKLDLETRQHFELHSGTANAFPSFEDVATFLDDRARCISRLPALIVGPRSKEAGKQQPGRAAKAHNATTDESPECPSCKGTHSLAACQSFREKTLTERNEYVKQSSLCFNCLRMGHRVADCTSNGRCKKCKRKHHSLLRGSHEKCGTESTSRTGDSKSSAPPASSVNVNTPADALSLDGVLGDAAAHHSSDTTGGTKFASLGTARVRLRVVNGRTVTIRALVDPGSQITLVSEPVAQALRAPRTKASLAIFGIDNVSTKSNTTISCLVEPCDSQSPSIPVRAFVLPRLTSYLPRREKSELEWSHLKGLRLADPEPNDATRIELLIGADLYAAILRDGVRRGKLGSPIAQETVFGWVVSGPRMENVDASSHVPLSVHHCAPTEPLNSTLRKFWEIEELNCQVGRSEDEEACETHFLSTHTRDTNGRYTVRLPFKSALPLDVGNSYSIAKGCLERQERRLLQNPQRQVEYDKFLNEYHELGHMKLSPADSFVGQTPVYLPHHAVIREDSSTSPLRVVFNASSATTNGKSLNDHLHVGQQLLPALVKIILRWRMHCVALRADIEKMFRQIRVHPDETHVQKILHKPTRNSAIASFDLCTVTYGTGRAPWLAMRVLQQLVQDERHRFPKAAEVLGSNFYVDDALTGADSIEEARELRNELQALLQAGGFNLRKWASSHLEVFEQPTDTRTEDSALPIDISESVKVLGVLWDVKHDAFRFRTTLEESGAITKRTTLSIIARIFDPVGWLSPTTITAKIFIQELWLRDIDWDEELPQDLIEQWKIYYGELKSLEEISIPRFVGSFRDNGARELHGFADASTRAYAAVVYLRVVQDDGRITVKLLIGKAKVAPTKQVTVARLELCAAHLLARVLEQAQSLMTLTDIPIHAWSDSEIVLAWLRKHASQWPTFVASRVSDIQLRLPSARWHHVPSGDNPADCASRGISPAELVDHTLWWTGPRWLQAHSVSWPCSRTSLHAAPEDSEEKDVSTLLGEAPDKICDIHEKFSTWPRLLRVTAYCLLFRYCVKRLRATKPTMAWFIEQARLFWISQLQHSEFAEEISALRSDKPIPRKSRLIRLQPFLDGHGLLRVGGRLNQAHGSFEEKHPLIVPSHKLTTLLIEQAHLRALHGGPQLTARTVRQQYWILGGRRSIRSVTYKCVKCARYRT